MTLNLGTVRPGSTILFPFNAFDSNDPSASVTISDFALADIGIYKGTSMTERASTTGVVLLETDGVDIDGATGIHGFSIDLSSDATNGFYSAGSHYYVTVGPITIDGATVNFVSATFNIGYPDAIINTTIASVTDQTQFILTDGPAEADVLIGCPVLFHDVASAVQISIGYITDYIVTTKEVFMADPGGFTFVATDNVSIFMPVGVGAMRAGVLNAAAIGADAITNAKIADDAIAVENIKDAAITVAKITALNSTAWGNLDDQYDGTGLTGDSFPATQTQVSNIAATGSTGKEPAKLSTAGFVITFGENEANNEDATRPLDGTTHDIEAQDDTGTERIDVYYEFDIGSTTPSLVTWHGRLDKGGGSAKNITVQAENVDASTWRTIGTINSGTSIETKAFDLFTSEVGTGNDAGIVRIRFLTGSVSFSATTKLLTDQIFITHGSGEEGYENGAVWFDSNASNTGTVKGKDGIATNPVSTMGAINTLLSKTNLRRVEVASNSTVTLAAVQENQVFNGDNWTLVLAGQAVGGSEFLGCKSITGIFTGTPTFVGSTVGSITGPGAEMRSCVLGGTITANAAGDWGLINCGSDVAGSTTPIFDFGTDVGVNTNLIMGPYHNGIELRNFNNSGTDLFSISGQGQIVYASSCSGTVNQRGNWKVTNTGGVTITEDDITANVAAVLADTGTDGVIIAPAQGPVTFTGASDEAGLTLVGEGTGPGLSVTGGATGHGFEAIGGATSGDGIHANADGAGNGMDLIGIGANAGLRAEGGATGPGIHAHGGATGATPGVEFHAHSATGDALELEVDGSGDTNADLVAILLDTVEIGTAGAGLSNIDLPDQTMDITGSLSGSVGSVTGAVGSVVGNVDGNVTGSVGSLAAQAKADVLVEINAALDAAISEIAQGVPTATPSVRTGIMLGYMLIRNKLDVATSGTDTLEVHNSAGTRIAQKLLTDDGADYSEAKMISGA